jgi:hypothetical protein
MLSQASPFLDNAQLVNAFPRFISGVARDKPRALDVNLVVFYHLSTDVQQDWRPRFHGLGQAPIYLA